MSDFKTRFDILTNEYNGSDTEIAEKLSVSKQTISAWKKGARSPRKPVLNAIAAFFDVNIPWLLGMDVERTSYKPAPATPEAPAPEAPAPGSKEAGWNVGYPAGAALHTARDPRPGEVASGLSETDIFRIAQKVKNLNDRSLPYANLNPSEAQLVENYRLLYPRQRLKVDSYIAKLLDGNEKDGE